MKHTTKHIGIIAAVFLVLAISTGAAAADGNLTAAGNSSIANQTYYDPDEEQEPATPLYIYTDAYQANYTYWLNYHKSLLPSEAEQKLTIRGILTDSTLNNDTKFTNVLTYIGLTDEYKTMVDETKHTIDEYSGTITWDLGFGNWWGRIFGGGVNEDDLPDTIAEMNAIMDIYHERYNLYSQVEWEMMFGDDSS